MLVVTSVLAQVDARLPPLSYSVWLVDFQEGCLTFTIVLFMLYAVLNFGIVQVRLEWPRHSLCREGGGDRASAHQLPLHLPTSRPAGCTGCPSAGVGAPAKHPQTLAEQFRPGSSCSQLR